jgi:hypothetical protein
VAVVKSKNYFIFPQTWENWCLREKISSLVTVQVLFSKCEEVVVTVSDFVRCRGSRCRDERSCTKRTASTARYLLTMPVVKAFSEKKQ